MTTRTAHPGRRKRARIVLVVEDDVDCRENICSTLKDAGYAALEAVDGAQALRLLLAEGEPEPMVIVLDLGLPIMSGPELLKVLKSYYRLSRIPVILTSAGPRYVADVAANAAWLPKPFAEENLLALVNERCGALEPPTDPGGIAG
jgi:DNA-binding response OmpR family regulator